jgi:SAM-dependent methyltransferase
MLPSPPTRWHDPALLTHLARLRQPWNALTGRIIRAVLARFLPAPAGPLVEIGAGGGQLRAWLPPAHAAAAIHTEPSEPFVDALRAHHPGARAICAEAAALPFAPKSVSAVLGLCVFDTVADLASVRTELYRILPPGGVVIHFLDLATSPDCLFPELIAGGELPLTNFLSDVGLLDGLNSAKKALLPSADEFDEVLAVKWDAFSRFVGMLERAQQPLARELGPYTGLHRPGALDPDRLARGFMAASADPVGLRALNKALLSLTLTAHQLRREWPLRAVSSRAHLRERLRALFGHNHGFAVEFAGPVSARATVPVDGTVSAGVRLVSRHAGRTVTRAEQPAERFGTPVEEFEGAPPDARQEPGEGTLVRETTVEVFVARRVLCSS